MVLVSGANRHDSMLFERCVDALLQSRDCKTALASGHTNFMQIRATTTHAAGGTSKSVESSVALPGEALKAVNNWANPAGLWNELMAGLLDLENCASDSSGAWTSTWLYSSWPLQSSAHASWIGGVSRSYCTASAATSCTEAASPRTERQLCSQSSSTSSSG